MEFGPQKTFLVKGTVFDDIGKVFELTPTGFFVSEKINGVSKNTCKGSPAVFSMAPTVFCGFSSLDNSTFSVRWVQPVAGISDFVN